MIAEKISSARVALSGLAGEVSEDTWLMIRRVLAELDCAAKSAKQLENRPVAVWGPGIIHHVHNPYMPQGKNTADRRRETVVAPVAAPLTLEQINADNAPRRPHLRLVVDNTQKGDVNV